MEFTFGAAWNISAASKAYMQDQSSLAGISPTRARAAPESDHLLSKKGHATGNGRAGRVSRRTGVWVGVIRLKRFGQKADQPFPASHRDVGGVPHQRHYQTARVFVWALTLPTPFVLSGIATYACRWRLTALRSVYRSQPMRWPSRSGWLHSGYVVLPAFNPVEAMFSGLRHLSCSAT